MNKVVKERIKMKKEVDCNFIIMNFNLNVFIFVEHTYI